ncbi:hypothetical protein SKAU_G00027220 [Synaphobranchus kaupii]|uniref:CCHC-type domain-containing protein n=1 Tax=Synaphobranchus kaupii TaxID=118154 RepID=A0A9Q1JFF2_SYNKA|nr:hypothetical protein SKAU_G00027220 [Synaphobranchus kaupii]
MAIRIDRHLSARCKERLVRGHPLRRKAETSSGLFLSPLAPAPLPNAPEPMQIDHTRLTSAERQCRIRSRSCLYCGKPGHFIANCQRSPIARGLQVVSVLMDSGADGNFMDTELPSQLHLASIPLQDPLEALAITSAPLIRITHVTPPVPAAPANSPEREAADLCTWT